MTVAHRPPCVLSIAGSDSGGGAGIQADLKAFARCGVHGMTAVTAITAQSTVGVTDVHPVPPETILAQVEAVADDIGVDAVKVGMLGSVETISAVARGLDITDPAPVVIDPVMVAESGASLLAESAVGALRDHLLDRAAVATPNVMEARVLAGRDPGEGEPAGTEELATLAREVQALGPAAVVVTGGHATEAVDAFCDGERAELIRGPRHPSEAGHGSGCTHSSALAAHLAIGHDALEAARRAREVAAGAVAGGLAAVGSGSGPVDVLGVGHLDERRQAVAEPAASTRGAL